ncbi:hypothetical protein GLAREA_04505 [Glarea lozoyensis ATCC 20868]|uniref:Uncharacterized protein n=1 Tax=Glarea lozoyensis (strain ATCC 20868 / MF5171) TaxID=1116229 RepID=S3CRJ5_GLAL2|nr:uncharacterized protein GLAREA_04505 [Glarea lozoyensis ATCC 20868]EPE27714.1 hypothetical protein GLAREA_04505 [Glarea lozoyensis ATCC 20868]
MRYQNWDVLVFPDQSKIPLQEFKTACQVIQDPESHSSQTNPLLLPTVTSFIPALPAGANFRVSIHSWHNPDISRYIQTLKKSTDNVVFEARVFVDGRIAGSKWFGQHGPWPTIIDLSIDLDKHGDFEKLKFPAFHKELLSQSYWNAGDDLGRVKVIIAEGFARDNLTYPFERIKNLVSLSFQHAPLEVLEASGIAWPNSSMWRQVSIVGPYYTQQFSPQQNRDAMEDHTHSPRRAVQMNQPNANVNIGSLFNQNQQAFPRQPTFDPFTEPVHNAFSSWRNGSSTDLSMPDYSKSNTRTNSSRQVTDPVVSDKLVGNHQNMHAAGAYESICEALVPRAPDNTPANGEREASETSKAIAVAMTALSDSTSAAAIKSSVKRAAEINFVKPEPAETSNTRSAARYPSTTESVQSRKENMPDSPHSMELRLPSNEGLANKIPPSFQPPNHGANKRQRIVTPAASKVIDDEDEPRSSPSVRKVSGMSVKQESNNERGDHDLERRILGEIHA